MLYITTRSDRDAFTSHRTLGTDKAPDDGLFIPMQFPHFSEEEVREITSGSFEEIVAKIVNVFYSSGLTHWDVGFCIGRSTVRLSELNSKIHFAELWHNPGSCMEYIENGLFRCIFGKETDAKPTEWFRIVLRIAIIFGIYGELCHQSKIVFGDTYDYSVPADDFLYPMAVLYAEKLGLPVGMMVCNNVDTHALWNLVHRGEYNRMGCNDCVLGGIERFVHLRLGVENSRVIQNQRTHQFSPDQHNGLREGLYCVVSGADRALQTVSGMFGKSGILLTPTVALCIAGLWDYRAKTGESKFTLVIEDDSPIMFSKEIEKATGLSVTKIGEYLKE